MTDINPKSYHLIAFEQLYFYFTNFECRIFWKDLKSTLPSSVTLGFRNLANFSGKPFVSALARCPLYGMCYSERFHCSRSFILPNLDNFLPSSVTTFQLFSLGKMAVSKLRSDSVSLPKQIKCSQSYARI